MIKKSIFNYPLPLYQFYYVIIYLYDILTNLVNFIVIGIFINKNTYIIPTNAYVTYRSVKDTDNVSRHVFSTESTHVNPRGHLLEVISPL